MKPSDLLQLIRTLTTAQVTTALEKLYQNDFDTYIVILKFFKSAKESKK